MIAYAKYANNGEIHTAAQALSKEQIEECYQAAFLLFLKKSYSEQTHQIMSLAAMGGHAFACVRMGFLQPSIEEIWQEHCDYSEYQSAKACMDENSRSLLSVFNNVNFWLGNRLWGFLKNGLKQ